MAQTYEIKQVSLSRLPGDSFTWSRWRRFNLFPLLGMACRYGDIIRKSSELQKYAVGWIEGERLICRPKENTIAVMWLKNDHFTWCHLTTIEFFELFKGD